MLALSSRRTSMAFRCWSAPSRLFQSLSRFLSAAGPRVHRASRALSPTSLFIAMTISLSFDRHRTDLLAFAI
jgi:hypothetical protein